MSMTHCRSNRRPRQPPRRASRSRYPRGRGGRWGTQRTGTAALGRPFHAARQGIHAAVRAAVWRRRGCPAWSRCKICILIVGWTGRETLRVKGRTRFRLKFQTPRGFALAKTGRSDSRARTLEYATGGLHPWKAERRDLVRPSPRRTSQRRRPNQPAAGRIPPPGLADAATRRRHPAPLPFAT